MRSQDFLDRPGIDAAWERTGTLSVATEEHQVGWMAEEVEKSRRFGWDSELLDRDAVQAEVHSPTYRAAARNRDDDGDGRPGAHGMGPRARGRGGGGAGVRGTRP